MTDGVMGNNTKRNFCYQAEADYFTITESFQAVLFFLFLFSNIELPNDYDACQALSNSSYVAELSHLVVLMCRVCVANVMVE